MPVYTYRCPECKTTEERRVPYEDRDDQLCMNGVVRPGSDEVTPCETKMEREEIELTSRTPGLWG